MKLWRLFLAIFLILFGLAMVSNVKFAMQELVTGFCAVLAGVLILFDR